MAKMAVPTSTALAPHLFRANPAYLSAPRKVSLRQNRNARSARSQPAASSPIGMMAAVMVVLLRKRRITTRCRRVRGSQVDSEQRDSVEASLPAFLEILAAAQPDIPPVQD